MNNAQAVIVTCKPIIGTDSESGYNPKTMKTIDHRILIPSPPEPIWEVISDISRNPDWQIDCREVIFLTSKRSGAGLRWRYSDNKRREFVYETSAWYPGLGYEYYFIDGALYRDARARLRLQETPEGTIVQWTFSFEFAGLFSGSHNALDAVMRESLRQLYSLFKNRRELREQPSKSLMRDAPDASARSAYQPRHPQRDSADRPVPAPAPARSQPVHHEPPIASSDTRPNPVASGALSLYDDILGRDVEPEFLADLREMARFEPPPPAEATQPSGGRLVQQGEPPVESTTSTPTPPSTARVVIEQDAHAVMTDKEIAPLLTEAPPVLHDTQPIIAVVAPSPAAPASAQPPPSAPVPSIAAIADTRSIWEIFNVPRPGDPVIEPLPDSPADEPHSAIGPARPLPELHDAPTPKVPLLSGTRGLRQTIRFRSVHLRRPF
jgi:hypothetical protein